MRFIMDKNEVITLSSDDESDFTHCPKNNSNLTTMPLDTGTLKTYLPKHSQIIFKKNGVKNMKNKKNDVSVSSKVPEKNYVMTHKVSPEIVDLEDCLEKTNIGSSSLLKTVNAQSENHSKLDIIDIDDVNENDSFIHKKPNFNIKATGDTKTFKDLPSNNIDCSKKSMTHNVSQTIENSSVKVLNETKKETDIILEQNLKFFTEFVEYCSCLEKIPNDRTRLTKKLMKKYSEADGSYIKSQEFINLIQKSRTKVNENNLYLIAKEITDELSFRKKTEKPFENEEICQRNEKVLENSKIGQPKKNTQSKKRTRFINKIIKKLDKLGEKIRELEEQEVDLSDEEESSYVRLQRYRERFCQIYNKLCKFNNEVADANRVYNRKICFTESKYPAINKCIENWLNKTKKFPDFSDIMKLLESQSYSLNLPSNRESIRAIANEIFQQVGAMLQRRRRYDLWDSCCGYLNDADDPANSDPTLEKALKTNFENRIKKENEIFQRFVELQEKERLKPEEVPDEEASHSPVDSDIEDEKEIEEIENSLNKIFDIAIKNIEENDNAEGNDTSDETENNSMNVTETDKFANLEENLLKPKESKNNYKNCKSLKWRLKDSNPEKENGVQNLKLNEPNKLDVKGGLDLELIAVDVPQKARPLKRAINAEENDPKSKKCIRKDENTIGEIDVFEIDNESENIKKNNVFDVQCCQIFTDNVFNSLLVEKKRKVFRDLTNVKRLLEVHGKKKKMSDFFSPYYFQRSFSQFKKSSWKRRFRVSFKLLTSRNLKCALNQDEKSDKTLNSTSNKDEKNVQDNPERAEDKEGNFASSHGNGSDDDDNEDENKKNGKTDLSENKPEEEDDEEENEAEEDNADPEPTDHSNQKTEESTDISPSESKNNFNENDVTVSESTNEQTVKSDIQLKELEKLSETPDESNELQSCNESVDLKDAVEENLNVESMDTTEPSGENENDGNSEQEKSDSKTETEDCLTKSNSEEKISETEKNNLETEFIECVPEVLGHSKEAGTDVELQDEKKISTDLPPYQKFYADTDNKRKKFTAEEIVNFQKPVRNLNNKGKVEKVNRNRVTHENEKPNAETIKRETIELKPSTIRKLLQIDSTGQKPHKKNTSASDEERVKQFLLHSPSSISITPPRKLSLTKPPSQAALQALATLRNLKGISATIVRGKPRSEDDVVVIGGSYKRNPNPALTPAKRGRSDLPVISSVQSIDCTTPKIVTVQGNVSGFENSWPEVSNSVNSEFNTSSIRISNVWGSLPDSFMPSAQNSESVVPGCSSRQSDVRSNKVVKKKTSKKPVEYVVLE